MDQIRGWYSNLSFSMICVSREEVTTRRFAGGRKWGDVIALQFPAVEVPGFRASSTRIHFRVRLLLCHIRKALSYVPAVRVSQAFAFVWRKAAA